MASSQLVAGPGGCWHMAATGLATHLLKGRLCPLRRLPVAPLQHVDAVALHQGQPGGSGRRCLLCRMHIHLHAGHACKAG